MRDFAGKTAVVTGGASGVGYGLATAFGERGARVALLDIEPAALEAAAKRLADAGVEARPFRVDVTDREAMAATAGEVMEAFGHIHILCNNAGVGTG
ncbi:MAG: SDR family NAD(P)-dependent oxidoreductase, partial [Alphaproteobacteria bacterium]